MQLFGTACNLFTACTFSGLIALLKKKKKEKNVQQSNV